MKHRRRVSGEQPVEDAAPFVPKRVMTEAAHTKVEKESIHIEDS